MKFRKYMEFHKRLFDLSSNQNKKPFEKSLHVCLPELFLEAHFLLQKQLINEMTKLTFWQEIITMTGPIPRGGMKFATQISPLLNYLA